MDHTTKLRGSWSQEKLAEIIDREDDFKERLCSMFITRARIWSSMYTDNNMVARIPLACSSSVRFGATCSSKPCANTPASIVVERRSGVKRSNAAIARGISNTVVVSEPMGRVAPRSNTAASLTRDAGLWAPRGVLGEQLRIVVGVDHQYEPAGGQYTLPTRHVAMGIHIP